MSAEFLRPDWPAPAGVAACVSLRAGGVSRGAYAALNLADHVGDDERNVAENRRRLAAAAAWPAAPLWLDQVHGCGVANLDDARGECRADAAFTERSGVVCAVLTADCLPVLFASRDTRVIGVAHAGWRGLAAGVIGALVESMPAPAGSLMAWLGPAIGAASYEVGDEVRERMVERIAGAGAAFAPNARGRWQADLYELARLCLSAAGVRDVFGGGFCTYREADRFFSHRREAPCGRMATSIWLEEA